jgi:dihydrofolate synthase/folylpolyglutamate synthase
MPCSTRSAPPGSRSSRRPRRLELVTLPGAGPGGSDAELLLDGAHNPAGAAALAAAFDELRPLLRGGDPRRPAPATLVLAIMGDKDVAGVLGALASAPSLAGVRVIATQVEGPRALPAAALAAQWAIVAGGRSGPVMVVPEPAAAVTEAIAHAEGPVVVAGSLYLVGAARALVVDDPDLRDPA